MTSDQNDHVTLPPDATKRAWVDIHPKVVGNLAVAFALLVAAAAIAAFVPDLDWAQPLLKAAAGAALASLVGYLRRGDEIPPATVKREFTDAHPVPDDA